jgi:hypothetical protein
VIDDIEARRHNDEGLLTNPLHLPSIPLATLASDESVPEYHGKTVKFLMVSFSGFKKQSCPFTWSDPAPQFGNAHASQQIAQSMCGPTELVEKMVVGLNNSVFGEVEDHNALKLLPQDTS